MSQRYKTSDSLNKLCLLLHIVKNSLEECEVLTILKEYSKKLATEDNFSETESRLSHNSELKIEKIENSMEKKDKFEKTAKDVLNNLETIENLIDDFLSNKSNCFKFIKNFLYNDSFGSIPQLKIELISRFNCEEIKIPIEGSINVDA